MGNHLVALNATESVTYAKTISQNRHHFKAVQLARVTKSNKD